MKGLKGRCLLKRRAAHRAVHSSSSRVDRQALGAQRLGLKAAAEAWFDVS